ncbi:TraU family protein [Hydrogenovibrio marinus]|uniref:Conjugal transfer protein n=1 Tax=Hydrogenovibrio marinus TaxID=28885 RepID=A0A066ZXB7_HYDMR|nr:TraU family protein [Hydrogenovibrio marinus]KDN94715.1 hypothetical protein EI16_12525 [Hydrogenovibrio marinus]
MNRNSIFFGLILSLASHLSFAESTTCNGKFPNPLTDYCWSGVFPIKVAGVTLFGSDQEDNNSTSHASALCKCGDVSTGNIKVGTTMSFWEPITMVDVVRQPFCFAGLGGMDMGKVVDAPHMGISQIDGGAVSQSSFYQVHWYANPILYWLGALSGSTCLDRSPFDILDITEVNPVWNDEELALITTNPDAYLYANPVAGLACPADCVTASAGFPNDKAYWCAGCQGRMFPLTGTVPQHIGTVQATSLVMQKFINMAHRQLMIWGADATGGDDQVGLCYKYPKYMMAKSDYKYAMLFPTPERKHDGKCAQPLGRTTAVWGAGTTFPFHGEDVVYELLRKRDCCEGAFSLGN